MKLDQFLKWKGVASTGGEAKILIREGLVTLNGSVETRRGVRLKPGDQIRISTTELIVPEISTLGPLV